MSSDPPSNRDHDRDASTTATRERVVLLAEHDPITVLETLPRTVFPVSARIELGRTVGDDKPYSDHDRGTLPVEPRRPEPVPYIPETTVYFTNPAERAPAERTAWTPQECADELAHLLDHFSALHVK